MSSGFSFCFRYEMPLSSTEQGRPLRDFDVLGFTLQHEMGYTNVLTMLDLGGVPLRSEARGDGDLIVIADGPGAAAIRNRARRY